MEDEKDINNFIKVSLEAECFAVDSAEDGEAGSYLARTNDYDIIILDNMLPKKNGVEIIKEIRKEGKTVPVIMLSVRSETTTKVDLLNSGADDYLTKPFSFQELLARIRALLRRPKNIEKDIINIEDLTVDYVKHKVKRAKEEIYLTKKEFMLLEYLLRNKGTVLSRGMILEHVWDMNADPFSNTVESHILNLRKKIDLPDKNKLIHTIPGRGYKIEVQK